MMKEARMMRKYRKRFRNSAGIGINWHVDTGIWK